MSIIPIIFFALVFGLGGLFSSTSEVSVTEEATPELSAPSPSADAIPGTNGEATMVKSMFDNRSPLPSCGTIEGDDRGEAAWQCLQDAADQQGNGAELVRIGITDEGDPIRTYIRVSYGAMEIYTDNSEDKFRGDPAWTFQACSIPADVRSECTDS